MKKNILVVYAIMALVVLCHSSTTLNATTNMDSMVYEPYPKPLSKPYQCPQTQVKNDIHLNKTQIAAAALGLYFGLRHATTPQMKKQDLNSLCI